MKRHLWNVCQLYWNECIHPSTQSTLWLFAVLNDSKSFLPFMRFGSVLCLYLFAANVFTHLTEFLKALYIEIICFSISRLSLSLSTLMPLCSTHRISAILRIFLTLSLFIYFSLTRSLSFCFMALSYLLPHFTVANLPQIPKTFSKQFTASSFNGNHKSS